MTKRREGRHENTSLLALGEARAGRMSIHFCFLPFAALLVKREIWSDSYRRHLVSNNYSSVVTLYLHHTTRSMWGMGHAVWDDIKILGHCSVSVCQYVCLCIKSGTISKFPRCPIPGILRVYCTSATAGCDGCRGSGKEGAMY